VVIGPDAHRAEELTALRTYGIEGGLRIRSVPGGESQERICWHLFWANPAVILPATPWDDLRGPATSTPPTVLITPASLLDLEFCDAVRRGESLSLEHPPLPNPA
jgi:hypothetical protein